MTEYLHFMVIFHPLLLGWILSTLAFFGGTLIAVGLWLETLK